MNFYSFILCSFVFLSSFQDKHFVAFKSDEVKISTNQELITVSLPFEILENYHIHTEKIEENNFIPTEIHFDEPDGFIIVSVQFSKVHRETLMLGELKCEVLSDDLEVTIQLTKNTHSTSNLILKGYLYYQACDDRQCFYPRNLHFEVTKSF